MRRCSSRVQLDAVLGALHARLQPLAHLQVVDVHELHADGAAVGRLQPAQDLAQGQHVAGAEGAGGEDAGPGRASAKP